MRYSAILTARPWMGFALASQGVRFDRSCTRSAACSYGVAGGII